MKAALALVSLALLVFSPVWAEAETRLAVATGSPVGVYFPVGNALCRLLTRDRPGAPGLPCAAIASAGSLQNIDLLKKGDVEIGFVQSDLLYQAAQGLTARDAHKFEKALALFSLHVEPFQLLAARRSQIESPLDLAGHKLGVGLKGSAQNRATVNLMALHQFDETDFAQWLPLGLAETHRAFCAGDIDAFGLFIGFPNAAFADDMARCEGSLVDIDTEAVHHLLAHIPYFAPVVIPRSAYPGMTRDVRTFGVVAIAAATSDMPEETAYRIVKAVMEGLGELKTMHPALATLEPTEMVTRGMTVPLHPGAARYFREKGWLGP